MKKAEILTFSNHMLDLLNPHPDSISIRDIAIGLSRVNRFGNQTKVPYTVLEHSIRAQRLMKEFYDGNNTDQRAALLHDSPEAYLYDMPKPVKNHLPDYMKMEKRLMHQICVKYNIPVCDPTVKYIDYVLLCWEMSRIMKSNFHSEEEVNFKEQFEILDQMEVVSYDENQWIADACGNRYGLIGRMKMDNNRYGHLRVNNTENLINTFVHTFTQLM